jgi:hypothetical protein
MLFCASIHALLFLFFLAIMTCCKKNTHRERGTPDCAKKRKNSLQIFAISRNRRTLRLLKKRSNGIQNRRKSHTN